MLPAMAQDGIRRITVPENTEITGVLDQAKVSAKVGTSRQVQSLKFLVETGGKFREPDPELEFGTPFHVELVFTNAEDPDALDVMVTLGDGRALAVRVLRQSKEPERYLSEAITLERLED
ncbi:hypothetical protein [Pararhizobium sp. IMCC21322]|uniref:hypothetical protein n=1 Tax=Pararhizobium sp. IMCC21322 TaxID=3067903 RepID=UPI0027403464|nr:hypothetical protein [Pararhizobium sp. IMCC21322]